MGMHELEHLRLICHKLLEMPILFLSISMEIIGKSAHVFLMVKVHLLNIKRYCVKALGEVMEGTDIVQWISRRANASRGKEQ